MTDIKTGTVSKLLDAHDNFRNSSFSCLFTIYNETDEDVHDGMIAYSELDHSGYVISFGRIAARSNFQYVINAGCVNEIGAMVYFPDEPVIRWGPENAGSNMCWTTQGFRLTYRGGIKILESIQSANRAD